MLAVRRRFAGVRRWAGLRLVESGLGSRLKVGSGAGARVGPSGMAKVDESGKLLKNVILGAIHALCNMLDDKKSIEGNPSRRKSWRPLGVMLSIWGK